MKVIYEGGIDMLELEQRQFVFLNMATNIDMLLRVWRIVMYCLDVLMVQKEV
jgi:hypothetical protein